MIFINQQESHIRSKIDTRWEDYFNRYPDKFIEIFYPNIKLHSYQKIILRHIYSGKLHKMINKYKLY